MHDILPVYGRAEDFIIELRGRKPLFICTLGSTETGKIPGLSAAGRNPEFTDYTPPADGELLYYGRCRCIEGVPVTPEGIPTPALITMSALQMADIPLFLAAGGLRVKPHAPFIDLGGEHGGDIRSGRAVKNVEEVLNRGKVAGRVFSKLADYLVVGESVPGGTTTALAVLLAMGIEARGKISSSMIDNPHALKLEVAERGLKAAGISFGGLKNDPVKAITCVGDPVMPAFAGLILGAAERIPVLAAGGTQMGAILAVVKALKTDVLRNVAVATTRWIVEDRSSDLKGIVEQIADVPILAADLDFNASRFEGLRVYEKGMVKEGVGAGGACVVAMLKSEKRIRRNDILLKVEENYRLLLGV